MPHTAVKIKLYLDMVFSQPLLQIERVGEKNFILPHLDIGGRKAREIRKKRRDIGIVQLPSLGIVLDRLIYIFLGKDGIDLRLLLMGFSCLLYTSDAADE